MKSYSITRQGKRSENQDSYFCDDKNGIYAVADGVGGGELGDVASQLAIQLFSEGASQGQPFVEVWARIHEAVTKASFERFNEPVMGTTLTGISIEGSQVKIGHIGDTRLYVYQEGLLRQLTHDQESYDERSGHTVLMSFLGMDSRHFQIEIVEDSFILEPKDKLLLCSDGLSKQLSEITMSGIIKSYEAQPQQLVEMLANRAEIHEQSDNVTLIWVEPFSI